MNYHTIEEGGNIFFIKGNKRIQVVTDTKIFFYLIDFETWLPTLENVMNNFMNCSIMMFGPKVKYGITYKTNQRSFRVYRRRYEHDFIVPVQRDNLEGAHAIDMPKSRTYLIAKVDKIRIYDSKNFEEVGQVHIPLLPSESREPNQIISITMSADEQLLACFSGRNLVMKQQKINQLFVLKKVDAFSFEIWKQILVRDEPMFDKVCM